MRGTPLRGETGAFAPHGDAPARRPATRGRRSLALVESRPTRAPTLLGFALVLDDEDGDGRPTQDGSRDASEEDGRQSAGPVAAHDDQIRVESLGRRGDLVARLAH